MNDTPAMLRLGLAAGGLRKARGHALLAGLRAQRRKGGLRLLDTSGRRYAAAGWICLAEDDGQTLRRNVLSVTGLAPEAAAPAIESELAVLAEGEFTVASFRPAGDDMIELQLVGAKLGCDERAADYEEIVLRAPEEAAGRLGEIALQLARDLPVQWYGTAPVIGAAARLELIEPPPVRAGQIPLPLQNGASAAEAFRIVARHCLAQFDANVLPALRNRDIEAVHQMRVSLRRLRSALGVFTPLLPESVLDPLVGELRWLNEPLGRKRDLDVFLSETLVPLATSLAAPKGLKHLATVLEDRRMAAQAALDSALTSQRCAIWRLEIARLLDSLDAIVAPDADPSRIALLRQPAAQFAAAVLQKRRKKVKALGRRHAELDIEELHELRIRAKKLRYAAEFFRPLFGRKNMRKLLAALAELQDCLGALNDAAVGEALMRDVLGTPASDPAAAAINGWFAGRQRLQLDHLAEAWEHFAAIKRFWKNALQ